MNEYDLTVLAAKRELIAFIKDNSSTVTMLIQRYESKLHSAVKESIWQLLDEETIVLTPEGHLILNPELG